MAHIDKKINDIDNDTVLMGLFIVLCKFILQSFSFWA